MLTIFTKISVLDVWRGFEYDSSISEYTGQIKFESSETGSPTQFTQLECSKWSNLATWQKNSLNPRNSLVM